MIEALNIEIRCKLKGEGFREMVSMNFPANYDMASEIYQAIKNIRDKNG